MKFDDMPLSAEIEVAARDRRVDSVKKFIVGPKPAWIDARHDVVLATGGMDVSVQPMNREQWTDIERWVELCNLLAESFEAAEVPDARLIVSVALPPATSPMLDDRLLMFEEPAASRFFSLAVRTLYSALPERMKLDAYGTRPTMNCRRECRATLAWHREMLERGTTVGDWCFALCRDMTTTGYAMQDKLTERLNGKTGEEFKTALRDVAGRVALSTVSTALPEERLYEVDTTSMDVVSFRRGRATLNPVRIMRALKFSHAVCEFVQTVFTCDPTALLSLDDAVEFMEERT